MFYLDQKASSKLFEDIKSQVISTIGMPSVINITFSVSAKQAYFSPNFCAQIPYLTLFFLLARLNIFSFQSSF